MNAIVAVDENWAIGRENALLKPISADLRRFKALTTGHPVILGRKTLATFPGGRPLPGRVNYILSRTMPEPPQGARLFRDLGELLPCAPADSFVIGGGSVYEALLPYCDAVYVTRIAASYPADTWFPDLDADPGWYIAEEEPPLTEDGVTFSYLLYRRKEAAL